MYDLIGYIMLFVSIFILILSLFKVWPLVIPAFEDPWKHVPAKAIIATLLVTVLYVLAVPASFFGLGFLLYKIFSTLIPEEITMLVTGFSFLVSASVLYHPYSKFLNFMLSFLEKRDLFENKGNGLQGYFEDKFRISDSINTKLTSQKVVDTFIDYGQKFYYYDEDREKIILKNNFAVKLNTKPTDSEKFVKLEFTKTKNKYYIILLLLFSLFCFFLSFAGEIGLMVVLGITALILKYIILKVFTFAGIYFDYSKEADKVFLEFTNAIREKEKN